MSQDDIQLAISQYMTEAFLFDFDESITETSNLFKQGLIDSFGFVQLIGFIEERFGLSFSEDDLASDEIVSLAGIAAMVRRRVAANAVAAGG